MKKKLTGIKINMSFRKTEEAFFKLLMKGALLVIIGSLLLIISTIVIK
jgi:hypothetical protein